MDTIFSKATRRLFYPLKPLIPRPVQIFLRRKLASAKRPKISCDWPIAYGSEVLPQNWVGWPGDKKFALLLTHDIESPQGLDNISNLIDLEMKLDFRSSFNFVPLRYHVEENILSEISKMGFEIGIHGLYHDGRLFQSRDLFYKRARQINYWLKKWNAVGFRAPAMHFKKEWMHILDILYDSSTFDTDPFEPQPHGMKTIFPFLLSYDNGKKIVELPYTLPQDFTMFVILQERSINIWKEKLDWIAEKGGMVLLNTHPDYMYFNTIRKFNYPASYYEDFLYYLRENYYGQYWNPLPRELATYCKEILLR